MKGDFTRDSFNPHNHYSRVLTQQGRVKLDADENEQAAILLHRLHTLAADLIGPHGGPEHANGFQILIDEANIPEEQRGELVEYIQNGRVPARYGFLAGPGRYYVAGLMCENEAYYPYTDQPDSAPRPVSDDIALPAGSHLVYLDVWERHISAAERDEIREVALGGPDTTSRAQVVWQIKTTNRLPDGTSDIPRGLSAEENWCDWIDQPERWPRWVERWQPARRGRLKARAQRSPGDVDPCLAPPEARFRGAENQLYRVEIHTGSRSADGSLRQPTFKWSRDNASVVFRVRSLSGDTAEVEDLGRDSRRRLHPGDWVEISDETLARSGSSGRLAQVQAVDELDGLVTLALPQGAAELPQYGQADQRRPLLRRWDYQIRPQGTGVAAGAGGAWPKQADDGALKLEEGKWLNLEDGVQVFFEQLGAANTDNQNERHIYRSGDYWMIPARTATGDVEWPGPQDNPDFRPPHGVLHHFAPLGVILVDNSGTVDLLADCRRVFPPFSVLVGS